MHSNPQEKQQFWVLDLCVRVRVRLLRRPLFFFWIAGRKRQSMNHYGDQRLCGQQPEPHNAHTQPSSFCVAADPVPTLHSPLDKAQARYAPWTSAHAPQSLLPRPFLTTSSSSAASARTAQPMSSPTDHHAPFTATSADGQDGILREFPTAPTGRRATRGSTYAQSSTPSALSVASPTRTTAIQVAPAAASAPREGRSAKLARGSGGSAGGGRRENRMNWYSTHLSFFFLFVLFVFAVVNIAGMIYFFKHGWTSRLSRRAETMPSAGLVRPPSAGTDGPPLRSGQHGRRPPAPLVDGGNHALEQETARRVLRGRRTVLSVLEHDFGALLNPDGSLSVASSQDATHTSASSLLSSPLSSAVPATLADVSWLPAPFFVPLLNLTVHALLRAARVAGELVTEYAPPRTVTPALWYASESVFTEGFSAAFSSVSEAVTHFDTLVQRRGRSEKPLERGTVRAASPSEGDVEEAEAEVHDEEDVTVRQHGKQFQGVETYTHRGLRFAETPSDLAHASSSPLVPAGALPNWASPSVRTALERLMDAEARVERALYAHHTLFTPSSSSAASGETHERLADVAAPLCFLPVHWLMHQLAPTDLAGILTLQQPHEEADVQAGEAWRQKGRGRVALTRALARVGIGAHQRGYHVPDVPPSADTTTPPSTGGLVSPPHTIRATLERQRRRTLLTLASALAFCDPSEADFHPLTDNACTRYLADPTNWRAMKPMTSTYASGRTIKYLLSFRHANVSAIVKVPQTGFVLEPMSEVAAYHLDRLLDFRRVPPTVLVEMPLAYLRASAATRTHTLYARWLDQYVLNAPATARARHACRHKSTQQHLTLNGIPAESATNETPACIWVSIQLWMNDVDDVERTHFAGMASDATFLIPKRQRQLVPPAPAPSEPTDSVHTPSSPSTLPLLSAPWMFSDEVMRHTASGRVKADASRPLWPPRLPPHWLASASATAFPDASRDDEESDHAFEEDTYDSESARYKAAESDASDGLSTAARDRLFYPLTRLQEAALSADDLTLPPAAFTCDAKAQTATASANSTNAPMTTKGRRVQASLRALMWKERHDQAIFDVIIDNQDRWEGHNLYVVGGCGPWVPSMGNTEGGAAASELADNAVPACVRDRRAVVGQSILSGDPADNRTSAVLSFRMDDVRLVRPARLRLPRLLYLDQGSGFFQRALPRDSPFHALAFATADAAGATGDRASTSVGDRPRRVARDQPATTPSDVFFCQRLSLPTLHRLESIVQQALWLHRRAGRDAAGDTDAQGGGGEGAERVPHGATISASTVRAYLRWRRQVLDPLSTATRTTPQKTAALRDDPPQWRTAQVWDGEAATLEAAEVGRALYALLRWRLPSGLGDLLPYSALESACRRVWSVLANRQRCAARYGEASIYL